MDTPLKRQLMRDYLMDSLNRDDDEWVKLLDRKAAAAKLTELVAGRRATLQRQKESADAEISRLNAEA